MLIVAEKGSEERDGELRIAHLCLYGVSLDSSEKDMNCTHWFDLLSLHDNCQLQTVHCAAQTRDKRSTSVFCFERKEQDKYMYIQTV